MCTFGLIVLNVLREQLLQSIPPRRQIFNFFYIVHGRITRLMWILLKNGLKSATFSGFLSVQCVYMFRWVHIGLKERKRKKKTEMFTSTSSLINVNSVSAINGKYIGGNNNKRHIVWHRVVVFCVVPATRWKSCKIMKSKKWKWQQSKCVSQRNFFFVVALFMSIFSFKKIRKNKNKKKRLFFNQVPLWFYRNKPWWFVVCYNTNN